MNKLSKRQTQVLKRICQGEKLTTIAAALGIHPRTVDGHLTALRRKAGKATTIQAVVFFVKIGV